MFFDDSPELSVIVPVYNEEGNIPSFLHEMARQQEVRFELIISDGGSADSTVSLASDPSGALPFPVRVIEGEKGRARQMNLGAGAARAEKLLFLHIDSNFPDPLSLRKGVDALSAAEKEGNARAAGRFALRFAFDGETPLPYRFYGAKATLDRRGCTHGDQGLLIGRDFFREVGPFDPALPLMEDTFLAERVRERGAWLLLPAPLRTSPRRFLAEGLRPRQTLNAILMNLAAIGRLDLIESLRGCYRSQHAAERLNLAPFLLTLRDEIKALPPMERRRLWRKTGKYVRSNAWQIPFFLDVLLGKAREGKGGACLALHDLIIGRLMNNAAADWGAAALVWVWFRVALLVSRRRGVVPKLQP